MCRCFQLKQNKKKKTDTEDYVFKGSIIWQMAELWTYYTSRTQVLLSLTNSGYRLGSILSFLCHIFLKEPHK